MSYFAIESFRIQNFRGIKDTQINDLPRDTRWILLTGENGFGKTSVLQALALELSNPPIVMGKTVSVKTTFDKFSSFANRLSRYVAAYGSSRLRVSATTSREVVENQQNIDSLLSADAMLIDIEERLKVWFDKYREGFDELVSIFKGLIPRLGNITVVFNEQTKDNEVLYFEKDPEGNVFSNGVSFSHLAAGYRNIIAMIGDMIYRLSTKQDLSENYSELRGIVIIDEIELHLHPKYQRIFVEKLTELFPNIQFIASTHSPIPFLGVPKETVILNVERTEEEGIVVRRLDQDIDFKNLSSEDILCSPILGFDEVIPAANEDLDNLQTAPTKKAAKEFSSLKAKLKLLKASPNVR